MKMFRAAIGLAAVLMTAGCGDKTAAPANTADATAETGVNAAEVDAALADANAMDAQEAGTAMANTGDTRSDGAGDTRGAGDMRGAGDTRGGGGDTR